MESLVLSPQDVENLEAMSDGSTGYFYKMLDYLEKRVEDGVRRGRFSEEAAKADLETALWYSYACNNLDEYESYCRAAQWMAASEGSAEAARCGMWYYRYSCALLYCGRLEEALAYAEKGVAVEPDYVWGWLQLGKLRSHFGDTAGALAAVERGLALEPGDYEFTTLAREIREGRSLEEMEYHWIDPEQDRRLQAGEAEEGEMADKRLAIACILCDRANLEAVKAALGVTEWEADAPYCTFTMPYGEGTVQGRFFGNEAALSKLSAEWAAALAARLPELDRRGRTFLELRAELQTDGLELAWFTIQRDQGLRLCFQGGGHSQMVLFGADFSLREEGQPALEQPGSAGNFLAFVLLEEPEWDPEAFKRALRDHWGIPCMTEPEDGEDGESTLVFEVEGMLAALPGAPRRGGGGCRAVLPVAGGRGGCPAAQGAAPGVGVGPGGRAMEGRRPPGEAGVRRLRAGGDSGCVRQRYGLSAGALSGGGRPAGRGRAAPAQSGVGGPLPDGGGDGRLYRRPAQLRQGRTGGAGRQGRARRGAEFPPEHRGLSAGGGRDPPGWRDHRLLGGAAPAHHPQRGCGTGGYDPENRLAW